MKQRFVGGNIYTKYDRGTNTFSDYLRSITEPIELEVTLLHKWEVPGKGMDNAWELDLQDGGAPMYIHSGVPKNSTGDNNGDSLESGGIFGRLNLLKLKLGYWFYVIIAVLVLLLTKNKKK